MDDEIELAGLPSEGKQFYEDGFTDDDRLFYIDGLEFRTVRELAEHMRRMLDSSIMDFKRLCHRLVDYDGELDDRFEAWLIMNGKEKELENWRVSINDWV